MQIKVALDDLQNMEQEGDSILKSLQNKSDSIVDLIIRESLQNSLDATIKEAEQTEVDYTLGKFDSQKLAKHFEGIDNILNNRFRGEKDFLSFRDCNTYGLTGDYLSNNKKELKKSNFQKLVFSIGKNQEADGAGGSWGLGKTSYFQIGVGIVIYYTRVKIESGKFEERLIASLVENPEDEKRLLKNFESMRGIAWWGIYGEDKKKLLPITNHDEIKDFLDIFGLPTYTNNQTGTTVIIPYLPNEDEEQENLEEENKVPWNKKREDAYKKAIERWYAPRLMNNTYHQETKNSMLICRFNGEILGGENLSPTFKLFQELYNSALTGKATRKGIEVEEVTLTTKALIKNNSTAGRVAFITAKKEDLGMVAPNNEYPPKSQVTSMTDEEQRPSKIVAYTRKPGMVVRYDIDGNWSKGLKVDDKNILAFFVPKSDAKMEKMIQGKGFETLEQYLRGGERSDHAEWYDPISNRRIINRITSDVARKLKANLISDNSPSTHISDRLARQYGSMLLPNKFGKSSSVRKGSNKKSTRGNRSSRSANIAIIDTEYVNEKELKLHFNAKFEKNAEISTRVEVQNGTGITLENWKNKNKDIQFPVIIKGVEVKSKGINEAEVVSDDRVKLYSKSKVELDGILTLEMNSNEYQVSLKIKNVKEGE